MAYCATKNCVSTNYNNYAGSGGSMLKKKYANKFNKVSANKPFSLNGYSNHSYIGNVNVTMGQNVSNVCHPVNSIDISSKNTQGISVKSSKGYLNSKMTANNSAKCYKEVNKALIDSNVSLNKHFRSENRSQASRIDAIKSSCMLDRDNYTNEQLNNTSNVVCRDKVNRNLSTNTRIQYLINCNNSVKDANFINGFTPGYDIYYNDSTLFNKKAACNLYNPPDAKIIAC